MNNTETPTPAGAVPWKASSLNTMKTDLHPPITAVIIENLPDARDLLQQLLAEYHPNVQVVGTATDVQSGIEAARKSKPDLIFLDIGLDDDKEGFDILSALGKRSPYVIVTTGDADHAVKAIKFGVKDYLVKPIDPEELMAALTKVQIQLDSDRRVGVANKLLYNVDNSGRLRLPTPNGFHLVPVKDILYCESARNYSTIFMSDGKSHAITRSLGQLEEELREGFMRIHKSHLVNLQHIRTYERGEGGQVIMSNNKTLSVSRDRKADLLNALNLN